MSNASIPMSEPEYSTFDINARVDELFAEHGYAEINEDGELVRAKGKVVMAIADILIRNALATTADERVERAMSKEVLYERVYPDGPSLSDKDASEEDREVAKYVAIYAWSMTAPSYDGSVQREIGNRKGASDLMLCRRKIARTMSVYVTRTDDLIYDDFVVPASEKVVKVADKTRRDMALAVQRRPSLESRIRRELESMAVKTSIALGVSDSAGSLTSGD